MSVIMAYNHMWYETRSGLHYRLEDTVWISEPKSPEDPGILTARAGATSLEEIEGRADIFYDYGEIDDDDPEAGYEIIGKPNKKEKESAL